MCAMNKAAIISAPAIKANNLTNNPKIKTIPVNVSIVPAKPIKLTNSTTFPPNIPNNFCNPCVKNANPTNILKAPNPTVLAVYSK